jgi:hypothetical protein
MLGRACIMTPYLRRLAVFDLDRAVLVITVLVVSLDLLFRLPMNEAGIRFCLFFSVIYVIIGVFIVYPAICETTGKYIYIDNFIKILTFFLIILLFHHKSGDIVEINEQLGEFVLLYCYMLAYFILSGFDRIWSLGIGLRARVFIDRLEFFIENKCHLPYKIRIFISIVLFDSYLKLFNHLTDEYLSYQFYASLLVFTVIFLAARAFAAASALRQGRPPAIAAVIFLFGLVIFGVAFWQSWLVVGAGIEAPQKSRHEDVGCPTCTENMAQFILRAPGGQRQETPRSLTTITMS